jgi:hypothetical protein
MQFTIIPADTYIWNISELNKFLIDHQGKDIEISTNQEGCCCYSIGLYKLLDQFKFNNVTIKTPNPLEYHTNYSIKLEWPWKFLNVKKEIETELHTWNKSKIFGTIYGRPLWHRIGIASHLMTRHDESSLVGCLCDPTVMDNRELFETNELFKHDISSFQNFGNIINRLPLNLTDVDIYTPGQQNTDGYVNQTKRIYENFFVDVVAETFTTGDCFFVTEKTVRPMLLKKPMILMASKDYIDYLLQMGFQTFYEFWSEDYDGYQGRERYMKILALIDELAKKSKKELEEMYQAMQPILDHNYNLLLTQSYNKTITKII